MRLDSLILLAYGPPRVTADAIDRARRLVDGDTQLLVVPAVPVATRRLRTHASAVVGVVDEVGRAGLEAAMEQVGAGTVLVVHDDVLLTRATIEAMLLEHTRRGHPTTAWTNDTGMPNSIGSLPPVRQAEAAIAGAAAATTRSIVHEVRTGCLLGSTDQVRRMLRARLTVARSRIRTGDQPIVVAEGAVVAHDSSCVDQVAPPTGPDGRPLLVAALIVRDEEEMLPDCLASLEGLVDHIVVCDTGSTDATREIARQAGAEVIEREWRDDFGWARNQVLDMCRQAWWVLQVDADERIVCSDPREARRLLATDVHDSRGLDITIESVDADGQSSGTHVAPRLFRPEGVSYVGALHEMPHEDGRPLETASSSALAIRHLGYDRGVVTARDKAGRNIAIARSDHDAARTGTTALQLARSLRMRDVDDPEISRLLGLALDDPEVGPAGRAHALACLADQALRSGDADRAMEQAAAALALVPSDDEAARVHAEAGLAAGRPAEVVAVAADRRDRPSPTPMTSLRSAAARERLAVLRAHVSLDDLPAAAAAADDLIASEPELAPEDWRDVVSVLTLHDSDLARSRLRDAALVDATGACIDALCRILPPADAAAIAAEVAERGTVSAPAIRAGLVAAAVADRADYAASLAVHSDLLDTAVVDRLVEFAVARGADDVAAELESGAYFAL